MKKLVSIFVVLVAISTACFAVTTNISVEGRLDATGDISAASFYGNGSNLTNVSLGGVLVGITIETAASGNYTVPTGVTDIEVILVGGGGAGGGAATNTNGHCAVGGGGGGGACTIKRIATSASTVYSFVVGAGGTGVSAGAGNPGSQSTFNAGAITANGGSGGTNMASGLTVLTAAGGAGGTAGTTGDFNAPGGAGAVAYRMSGVLGISGFGGASLYGPRSVSVYVPAAQAATTGTAGVLYGGGGAGGMCMQTAAAQNAAGGAGAAGVIIIREYK